jgi:hypothetical protein
MRAPGSERVTPRNDGKPSRRDFAVSVSLQEIADHYNAYSILIQQIDQHYNAYSILIQEK